MTYDDLDLEIISFVEDVPSKRIEEVLSRHVLDSSRVIVTENRDFLSVEGYGDLDVVFIEYDAQVGLVSSLSSTKRRIDIIYGGELLDLSDKRGLFVSLVEEFQSDFILYANRRQEGIFNAAYISADGAFPCEFDMDDLDEHGDKWITKIYKIGKDKIDV